MSCLLWLALISVDCFATLSVASNDEAKPNELTPRAKAFVDLLAQGEFAKATKDFDETMSKVMPADKLEETWKSVTAKVGAFKKQTGTRTAHAGKYEIVFVSCEFEQAPLDVKVVFDRDKRIAGLFFTEPKKAEAEYQPPAYVKRDSFKETEVKIGTGEWVLPGTLAMPTDTAPAPAVVLVHGSGPQDRDEMIGPNRPFRDLAWGLASRGVAVLRYEKRTKEHRAKLAAVMDKFTVKEEVVDDALAAIALLRTNQRVDARRIFLLGHSLGASCGPRILSLDPGIAGFVCLAGTTRSLEDVIVDQVSYVLSLKKKMSEEQRKELEKLKEQAVAIKGDKLTLNAPASSLPGGTRAAYWLSLRELNPADAARPLKQPMLILQGERDYQVTMEDFQGWKNALSSHANVVFKSYPSLNHLFMEGEGKAKPSEYEKTGHVSQMVIDDIADWIKRQ
jgi:dienelactone hydrolase